MAKLTWVQMGESSWALSATIGQPWGALIAKESSGNWSASAEDTVRRRAYIPAGTPFSSAAEAKRAVEQLIREQSL